MLQVIQFGNSGEFGIVDKDRGEMITRGAYKKVLIMWREITKQKTITNIIKV